MKFIKLGGTGDELHADSVDELLELYRAFQGLSSNLNGRVAKHESGFKPALKIEHAQEMAARFNPGPGKSYADRAERALKAIGRPAKVMEVFNQIREDDPEFAPNASRPEATLRAEFKRLKKRFVVYPDSTYGLISWNQNGPA